MISSFELQIVTIINSKPHRLLDSSILSFDGVTFCSTGNNSDGTTFYFLNISCNGSTFCFLIIYSNEATFCLELPNHHHLSSISLF
jgi:hypothetical protein